MHCSECCVLIYGGNNIPSGAHNVRSLYPGPPASRDGATEEAKRPALRVVTVRGAESRGTTGGCEPPAHSTQHFSGEGRARGPPATVPPFPGQHWKRSRSEPPFPLFQCRPSPLVMINSFFSVSVTD